MKQASDIIEYYKAIELALSEKKSVVLVTITQVRGSAPGKTGFRMLAGEGGRILGTIGGGGGEYHALEKCRNMLKKGDRYFSEKLLLGPGSNRLKGEGENIEKLEALCGGEVSLFYEAFTPVKDLYIFGAGHVGRAVARISSMTGFRTTFIDGRKEALEEVEKAENIYTLEYDPGKLNEKGEKPPALSNGSYVLILTHSHLHDYDVLKYIYANYPQMKYVGMIGSVKKVRQCVSDLKNELGSGVDLGNLYSPVGLAIGGETPAEIAISIMAEIQALDNGKEIRHMKLEY